MRYLIDTHIFLWWIKGDTKLPKTIHTKILEATEVYVSSASIWESAIKIKLGKLDADLNEMVKAISTSGFFELPITTHHAAAVARLPDIHRDPFDRILIAQAITEPLILLTVDSQLKTYSELVEVLN